MAREISKKTDLREMLFAEKEFVDVKILCNGKTFECHKIVLSCQSQVFKAMIENKTMVEKEAGVLEFEENDISSDVMEQVVFFLYHDKVENAKMINPDLLHAAVKYNIKGLLDECRKHFESTLSLQNALDILVLSETTNQENLFVTASRFVGKNLGSLEKSNNYQKMVNEDPNMLSRVFFKMLEVAPAPSSDDSSSDNE